MVAGVDASIILYACVHRDLLSVLRNSRSTADPVDLEKILSIIVPGCSSTPASNLAESMCMAGSFDSRMRLLSLPSLMR